MTTVATIGLPDEKLMDKDFKLMPIYT